MEMWSRRAHASSWFAWLLVALALARPADAQAQSAEARVRALEQRAMSAYSALDLELADTKLDEALALATREGVGGATLARVHLSRGVLAVGGHGDTNRGVDEFMRALAIDPSARVDPMVSSPEIQSAFALARTRIEAGGRPGSGTRGTAGSGVTPPASGPSGGSTGAGGTAAAGSGESTGEAPSPPNPATTRPVSTANVVSRRDEAPDESESREEEADDGIGRPRTFLQGGGVVGLHRVHSGMPADDAPPSGGDPARYAGYVPDGTGDCDAGPGEYCVRVDDPGFALVYGVRATVGYWMTRRLAMGVGVRAGLSGWKSAFAFAVLNARLQVLVSSPANPRLQVALLAGVGLGQVQVRPDQPRGVVRPWAQTGLASVSAGGLVGYRFLDHFGVFAEVDAMLFFPNSNYGVDVTVGPEISF